MNWKKYDGRWGKWVHVRMINWNSPAWFPSSRIAGSVIACIMLASCASGEYTRTPDGSVHARYSSLFKDISAPSVEYISGDTALTIRADGSTSALSPEELQALGSLALRSGLLGVPK